MISIPISISWPSAIPLPFLDYADKPRYNTIVSPMESGVTQRRSRSTKSYHGLSVRWVLTPGEFDAFKEFFETTLGNGIAQFTIELRFPKNSDLDTWIARFIGGYEHTYDEGIWSVSAQLDIVGSNQTSDYAYLVGWGQFYVVPEESADDPEEFITSDGNPFYVKD